MISYEKFKELFNCLESYRHPEIGIYFKNDINNYLIIKFEDYITIGKCDCEDDNIQIYKFNNLDELYNAQIDDIVLREVWNEIDDILIDLTFSVIDDKDELSKMYNIDL